MGKLNAAGTRIIERAEGVFIYDSTGRKYLDAFAGLWCVNIGYGRREIADVVRRQMNELPITTRFSAPPRRPRRCWRRRSLLTPGLA